MPIYFTYFVLSFLQKMTNNYYLNKLRKFKIMKLENLNLVELNATEAREIDGGWDGLDYFWAAVGYCCGHVYKTHVKPKNGNPYHGFVV